ncbi:MAG: DUF1648 domain-containing protein [Oscillospiraceae bacterium]|nr:DUF1648 domain-containing protein [Oscillospiraceae bacterium]
MRKVLWILAIVPLAVTAVVLQFMPDKIPAHYNFAGEIDRWGSKYESFIYPLIIIAMAIFWECINSYYCKKSKSVKDDKQRAEIANNIRVIGITAVATTVLFNILHYISLYKACTISDLSVANVEIDSIKITCVLMGLLFVFIGNIMPKTKLNGTIGLRCTYSMYNDVTWSKSNRFAGFVFVITGILTVITSLIFNGVISMILMMVYLIVSVIIMILYAKKIYEEENIPDNN